MPITKSDTAKTEKTEKKTKKKEKQAVRMIRSRTTLLWKMVGVNALAMPTFALYRIYERLGRDRK